jgi:hypothetical protein
VRLLVKSLVLIKLTLAVLKKEADDFGVQPEGRQDKWKRRGINSICSVIQNSKTSLKS